MSKENREQRNIRNQLEATQSFDKGRFGRLLLRDTLGDEGLLTHLRLKDQDTLTSEEEALLKAASSSVEG